MAKKKSKAKQASTPASKKKPTKKTDRAKSVKKSIKEARSKRRLKKDEKSRARAEYLSTLPKSRIKRLLHRLHPKRLAAYWFSKQGLIMGLKLTGIGIAALGLTVFGLFAYYRKDLPSNIAELQACVSGQTTEYYDRTGETLLWASKGNVECTPAELENINQYLIDAVLAVEDKDFYEHGGFKGTSVIRAAVNNATSSTVQGGSTITQQYVKNAILKDSERRISRKIKELILSIELENTFAKNDILNAYLNVASFGSVYDGIEAASQGYFGKSAADLTLDESALLASAIPAPGLYWSDPERHQSRQQFVLGLMLEQNRITQDEHDQAIEVDTLSKVIRERNQFENIIAPHFVLEAEKRLIEDFGEGVRKLGYKVITTIDLEAQVFAEDSVADAIPAIESRGFDNGAAVAVDVETGKVIAHVGSRDFNYPEFGQTNTVTTPRDPGSAFKIFDYGALIESTNDWGAGSTFYDFKTTFAPGYSPKNYNGQHRGPISLRRSLGASLNIPAIKAMYIAGIDTVHDFAYDAGLRTRVNCGGYCGLSSSIGSGVEMRLDELTNSYATFSRGGTYLPLTYIDKIYDADGALIREWTEQPEEVFDPQTAYILSDILSDNSVRFTKTSYVIPGAEVAVKTGTTDNFKNNTVLAYSKGVAFGAWLGHHDVTKNFRESFTTPIKKTMFQSFMRPYLATQPTEKKNKWDRPDGIKGVRVDLTSGYQSENGNWDIYPSWYVAKRQDQTEEALVDIVTGKRATECTPERAIQVVTGGSILPELAESDPYYRRWMDPIIAALGPVVGGEVPAEEDDLHDCGDVPPSVVINSAPATCDQNCTITVNVAKGTHDLDNVNFSIDGQILPGGSIATPQPGNYVFTYSPNVSGVRTLTVEVVDSALYHATTTTDIEFEQQSPVTITNVNVIGGGLQLQVAWSRVEENLTLVFGEDCSSVSSISLPNNTTTEIIDSSGFPSGDCSAYISNNGSNSTEVEFEIP
ncbi:MAG: transglycosylase domain-containing protein [Patescibacteria group bacterium]